MRAFDLTEMARLVGMTPAKAKNWTVGRPFTIAASAYQASGRGSINLYSIEDVYLMAVAHEFSKAGFAAKAIGKLVESLRARYPSLEAAPALTVWRPKAGGKFEIAESGKVPIETALRIIVDAPSIVQSVNERAERLANRKARKR
jgi:DNA-binding transcriptional MerR regulator